MRLIDADLYKEGMTNELPEYYEDVLDAQPTIDAEPVKRGKWIRQTDTRFGELLNDILICSECNVAFPTAHMIRRSYCPNCGTRMDREREERKEFPEGFFNKRRKEAESE